MIARIHFFNSLRNKLIFLFLATSLIPFIVIGLFVYFHAQQTLESEVINKLIAVRDIKARQIEDYFKERLADLTITAQNPATLAALKNFEGALHQDMTLQTGEGATAKIETKAIKVLRSIYLHRPNLTNGGDGSAYSTVHAEYHPLFKRYLENYGYYDLFLVELHEGLVIYSTAKEDDFGTSLTDGIYANTPLGKIFKRVANATEPDFTALLDFAYHEPSKSPTAFIAAPIFEQAEIAGMLVLKLSTVQVDNIMLAHSGLGKTGEPILVGADDFLLRSSSRFSTQDSVLKIKVDTQDSRIAANGEIGVKRVLDYRGEEVFSAYTPLNIPEVRWLLDVKINTSEAFAPVDHLFIWMLVALGFGIIAVSTTALVVSNIITYPIYKVTKIARQLAAGDMTPTDLTIKGRDELATMAEAFRQMISNQRQIIGDIVRVSQGLAEGDLQVTYMANYQGDLAQIERAIETALFNLRQQVIDIVKITQGLAEGNVDMVPQAQYKGEFIKIQQALVTTTRKLTEVTAQNAKQNWLKSGLTKLNDKLRGERDVMWLAKNIIDFIASHINVQVGLLYLIQDDEKQTPYLQKVASYAYTAKERIPDRFLIGEGLVGQVALDKKPLARVCIPDTHNLLVQSSLVQVTPQYVLLMPFLYEDTVKGIVELGSAEPFTDIQREFLDRAMLSIGIAINSAQARDRLQALVEYSQKQAKELQIQQTTLQQANEELQVQAEELQTQQEELRQSNDELAVRTKKLEQQQKEIHEKNIFLEKARQQMETKARELELASQYKSEFLANMSHELRTPLNSLLILAQMLTENKQGNLTEKQLEYVSTIYSAGSDLLNLINDILDLSKIEAGKIEIVPETINIADLIYSTRQKFMPLAQNKAIAFECQIAQDIPTLVFTDGQRLMQIINNLLSNALKFTTEGSVVLHLYRPETNELAPLGLQNEKMLVIRVTDTGIGIPPEKQQIIFEAFKQADGTTSRRYGGTGLGLSISRQLARLLGGELLVSSIEGKGSRFSLYIPEGEAIAIKQLDIQMSASPNVSENIINQSFERVETVLGDDRYYLQPEDKVILIIEDDYKLSTILMELAQDKDFKCLRATDGKSGLQLAQQYKPHAIVLDIGLPQMDGWTVMEKLKDDSETRHIPVHFISASEQAVHAKRMGAIGFSLKPVSFTEVGETFKHIAQFIAKTTKQVLAIVAETHSQQKIQTLIEDEITTLHFAATVEEAMTHSQETGYDCIIIDSGVEQAMSLGFFDMLKNDKTLSQIPIIIYSTQPLTLAETEILEQYANNLPVKTVQSYERLLDEVTLFLHRLSSQLPTEEKPTVLRSMYEKEAVLVGKKVLVVDDDSRNVFALTVALDERGMVVSNCENGQQALNFLNEQADVDIVLMDIMMPGMDGYETIRQIRAQPSFHKLPIIALTAKAMKGDKAKCIEAGANDYLAKPVDTEQLISLMRVWLYKT